ncbi:MAG: UDP-3-O-acyl-N-acetylglucosamine deacetylase [bacterium]
MSYQHTIKRVISCSGIGLHSGRKVHMTLRPNAAGEGIVFRRTDLAGKPSVRATPFNVVSVEYSTCIKKKEVEIKTVEHLMAAFAGLGVDNVVVELDAGEVPIMDGSATPFVYLIHEAGLAAQSEKKRLIKIKKPVTVTADGDKYITVTPANNFQVSYYISFDHPMLRDKMGNFSFKEELFVDMIARARTFGFLRDIERLRHNGLIKGGSLDNAIVLDAYRIINGKLRFKEEFTSHKILDLIGDMYLTGYQLLGQVTASRSGHSLHVELAKKILSNPASYTYVEGNDYLPKRRYFFNQLVNRLAFSS